MRRLDQIGLRRVAVIIAFVVLLVVSAVLAMVWTMPGLALVPLLVVLGQLVVVLWPRWIAANRPTPHPRPGGELRHPPSNSPPPHLARLRG